MTEARPSFLRRNVGIVVAGLGGVTFALTAPPTNLYPAVLIGLAALAFSIADAPTGWRAFGRGVVWGTSAGIVGLHFVPAVILRFTSLGVFPAVLALILISAAQSLLWAIGAGVTHTVARRLKAPFELAFGAGVFVAASLPTVFAWTPAGLLSPWPILVQGADVIGERGVSAIVGFVAALLARAALRSVGLAPGESLLFAKRPSWSRAVGAPIGVAASVMALLSIYGIFRMRAVQAAAVGLPTLRVGLVNQSVGPQERWEAKNHAWILRRLRDLTKEAESKGAELTIWPEAAYPYTAEHDADRLVRGPQSIVGGGVRGPVLTGLITRAPVAMVDGQPELNSYNSSTIIFADGSIDPPSDKVQLLWFGEMVPGGAQLPWLRRIFQKSGGLIPGSEARGLMLPRGRVIATSRDVKLDPDAKSPSVRIGVLNCYEDTLSDVGRAVASAVNPTLLVNVTNDAWFFDSPESDLHARLGAMRAVELRRDAVRAVNMGVTTWVDASGRVRARYDLKDPAVTMAEPTLHDDGPTLYARFGDKPFAALLVGACLYALLRARRKSVTQEKSE
jgi:apolipoprotein N-acyltransferase